MRFFFDVVNGTSNAYDYHGKFLNSEEEAREVAEVVSIDLACSEISERNETSILVRNSDGQVLFSVPVPVFALEAA